MARSEIRNLYLCEQRKESLGSRSRSSVVSSVHSEQGLHLIQSGKGLACHELIAFTKIFLRKTKVCGRSRAYQLFDSLHPSTRPVTQHAILRPWHVEPSSTWRETMCLYAVDYQSLCTQFKLRGIPPTSSSPPPVTDPDVLTRVSNAIVENRMMPGLVFLQFFVSVLDTCASAMSSSTVS